MGQPEVVFVLILHDVHSAGDCYEDAMCLL